MTTTDERAIQRVTQGILVKVAGILLGLALAGICGVLWSTVRDVHALQASGHVDEVRRLRERVRELERSAGAGPEWMRTKIRDHDARLDAIERR